MRSVAESGEVLVRRRRRRLSDGYPVSVQLQVLEADYLDTSKTTALPNGGQIIQGVEFDVLGNLVAYWLFRQHPGSTFLTANSSPRRIVIARTAPAPAPAGTASAAASTAAAMKVLALSSRPPSS